MTVPCIIVFIAIYALADRFAGGGWPWLDSKLPGRPVFWSALVCAGAGWLALGLFGALCGLTWLIWRSPSWKLFGGSAAPESAHEDIGLVLRHMIVAPFFIVSAYLTHRNLVLAVEASLVFAILAALLGSWLGSRVAYHRNRNEGLANENTYVELARGALFGLAVGLVGVIA